MNRLFGRGKATLLVLLGLALLVPGAALAQSQEEQGPSDREAQFRDELDEARVHRNPATGKVGLIGTDSQDAIERPARLSADAAPEAAARAHLSELGTLFGLRSQAQELRTEEAREAGQGRSLVHFQQIYQDVPVLGGELNVQVNDANELLVANGEILPKISLDTDPAESAGEARDTALQKIAADREEEAASLSASDPALWIYDPTLLGGPGIQVPRLVWRMEVTPDGLDHFNELVLVDAQRGNVALNFDQIHNVKDRQTYDSNDTNALPGTLLCDESNPCTDPSYDNDAQLAHRYSGETYDFYASNHARDSLDGAGMALKSSIDYCRDNKCPYGNAFWNGQQMVYGDGFAAADDVVGHELTHGLTDHTSHLFYYYQSGAINESLSDVWGEFVDLSNTTGTDTAATRWQIGEDVPGFGAFRDMEDPTFFGDPDHMQSPFYWQDASERDSGGVHHNSGVNNKAAFLMTDGGTLNGRTVTGLGISKVAKIYYEVQTNLLTSASDYQDLHAVLQQACATLTGTSGITADDCQEVKDAVDATQMNQTPARAPNPEAPVCSTGETQSDLFFDDLENTASGNWVTEGTGWYYPQNTHSYDGWDFTYATSGDTNFWGDNSGVTSDHSIATTTGVSIPASKTTYLRFNHAYGFHDLLPAYDGGVLEYDTGSGWQDAGPLITDNGYNGTMTASFDNPLGGRQGFVRESNGYISTRVDFSSLGGESVRFRFRIGEDSYPEGYDYGWFIDDVRVYTCSDPDTTPPDVVGHTPNKTRNVSPRTAVSATFSEDMDESTVTGSTFKLVKKGSTTLVGASLSYDPALDKATLRPTRKLKAGATYTATITTGVEDLAGNNMGSPETWAFKIKR